MSGILRVTNQACWSNLKGSTPMIVIPLLDRAFLHDGLPVHYPDPWLFDS